MKEEESVDGGRIEIIGNLIDLASFKNVPQLEVEVYGETLKLTRKWIVRGVVRSCTIEVRRYVDAEKFALMLGLYRADGLKKYERVRFTNKDPLLHRWFIEPLKEMGVRKFLAYCYYCYCEKCGQEKLEKTVREFEKTTGVKVIRRYQRKLAHNPLFITDINSKPLAIFIKHAEIMLRKQIAHGNVPKHIASKYIRGVLEGDGGLNIRIKEGKADGAYLLVFETDNEAIKDILTIFERYFSIRLRVYPEGHIINGRQVKSISLDDLLKLLLNNIIPDKYLDKVVKRMTIALRRKGTPWILLRIFKSFKNRWFSSKEASEILSKPRHHTLEKLKELEKKKYLVSTKKKIKNNHPGTPIRRLFRLTKKGKKVVKILYSLPLSPPTFLHSLSR